MTSDDRATAFTLQRLDIVYKAPLHDPQFSLANAPRSFHFLFSSLKPFGLRPADLKLEGNLANPGEFSISCPLPNLGTTVRLRFDTVEVNVFSPPQDALLAAAVAAV